MHLGQLVISRGSEMVVESAEVLAQQRLRLLTSAKLMTVCLGSFHDAVWLNTSLGLDLSVGL